MKESKYSPISPTNINILIGNLPHLFGYLDNIKNYLFYNKYKKNIEIQTYLEKSEIINSREQRSEGNILTPLALIQLNHVENNPLVPKIKKLIDIINQRNDEKKQAVMGMYYANLDDKINLSIQYLKNIKGKKKDIKILDNINALGIVTTITQNQGPLEKKFKSQLKFACNKKDPNAIKLMNLASNIRKKIIKEKMYE